MITYYKLGSNGRLGNQIFQFISSLGIAQHNNYDCKFNFSHPGCLIHKIFNINNYAFTKDIIPKNIISEKSYYFDNTIFNCCDNISLFGFLQSYKYFNQSRDSIKNILNFIPPIIQSARNRLQIKNYISIHVRRTDYLNKQIYTILDMKYYKTALELTNPNYEIIIFSDDISWCKIHFQNIKDRPIRYCKLGSAESLYAMTLCKEHIIANSTFSWWGAYLSDSTKIICPKKWFNNPRLSDQDLIPDEWIRI